MNQDYMKTKPILPLVLSMSLPMVLSGTLTVAEPLILKNVDYNVIFLSNFLF